MCHSNVADGEKPADNLLSAGSRRRLRPSVCLCVDWMFTTHLEASQFKPPPKDDAEEKLRTE